MRLLGAFFLIGFFMAPAHPSNQNYDYSIGMDDSVAKRIVIVNNSSTVYPHEVIDVKERSIRFINTGSEIIPMTGLVFSVISIILSISIPIYLHKKNKEQSILDDFWARQVFYPDYFKPFLEYSYWLKNNINTNFNEQAAETLNLFYIEFLTKFNYLKSLLNSLGIEFDINLFDENQKEIQDNVAKYANLLLENELIIVVNGVEEAVDFMQHTAQNTTNTKFEYLCQYQENINALTSKMTQNLLEILLRLQGKKPT